MAATLFEAWERNRAAELFILENWRVPEPDMVALMELQGYAVRRRKDGAVMDDGKQMRLALLLMSIYGFGDVCYASQQTIAGRMRTNSRKTVYRAITDAVLLGVLVETANPFAMPSRQKTNAYTIGWRRLFNWCVAFHVDKTGAVLPTSLQGVDGTPSRPDGTPSRPDGTPSRPDGTPWRSECPTIPILKPMIETHKKLPCVSEDGFSKFSARGKGKGGWNKSLTRYTLANREHLEELFAEAQLKGWIPKEPREAMPALLLKFATLATYCVRRSAPHLRGSKEFIEDAGAVFSKQLKRANDPASSATERARAWLGADGDEEHARRLLHADGRGRDSDLLAEQDLREQQVDHRDATARLKQWAAERAKVTT